MMKDKKTKAQASIEFMNMFIILFIIVTIFSAMFIKEYSDIQKSNGIMQAKNLATIIGEEINKAWSAGNGFSTILPPTLLN